MSEETQAEVPALVPHEAIVRARQARTRATAQDSMGYFVVVFLLAALLYLVEWALGPGEELVFEPAEVHVVVSLLAAAAIVAIGLAMRRAPEGWVEPLTWLACAVGLAFALTFLGVTQQHYQSLLLIMVLLVAPAILLDLWWIAALDLVAVLGWLGVAVLWCGAWPQHHPAFGIWLANLFFAAILNLYFTRRRQLLLSDLVRESLAARSAELRQAAQARALRDKSSELTSARDRAQQLAKARSDFLAKMSHEIRTPLNGVIGMAQLLEGTELDVEQADSLRTIVACGDHLLAMVDEILELSRLEAGEVRLAEKVLSPAAVGKEVISFLKASAPEQVELRLEYAEGLAPELVGDPARLRQIMLNLVANALKFTDEGEVVLALSAGPGGEGLGVEVRDTGAGIKPEAQRRIFEPFNQADPTQSRSRPGVGLGLAIVRRLVDAFGGGISLESELGKGSTFRVELPLPSPSTNRGPSESPEREAEVSSESFDLKVLVVEDNRVNQVVARRLLERLGCAVALAANGQEGLELIRREGGGFDMVFMDCHMPVLDGYSACEQLRLWELQAGDGRVPVVALTADVTDESRERCRLAGMDDFIAKPVRPDRLVETLQRWTDRSRSAPVESP